MITIYMLNKKTNNRIFITEVETQEEADEYIANNTTEQFIYYIGF